MHVGHVIIDGVIKTEATEGYKLDAEDGKLEPDGVSFTLPLTKRLLDS